MILAQGGSVEEVVAYRTLVAEPNPSVMEAMKSGAVDVVTFTSSSTARNFATVIGDERDMLPSGIAYASIGPETTKAARGEGFTVDIEADKHNIDGLVEAIVQSFPRNL